MKSDYLTQLQACCRDQAAFEQMQHILSLACEPWPAIDRYRALLRVISKIRETLDLETIFQTTVKEVQQLLQADRVAIFRFLPNSNWSEGEFVSEAVLPGFTSALTTRIHEHCFGENYASYYRQGRLQAIADTRAANLQACYLEVLARFQIRANLVVPLLQGYDLWGLLCVHQCATPRSWQPEEIEFATQIAAQIAIALQQAERLTQSQLQSQALTDALQQLQTSQTQLIQSEKLAGLGELVAGIAHEISNPVNFICGNLEHAHQYAQHLIELLLLYQQEVTHPSPELQQRLSEVDLDFMIGDFPKLLSSMQLGSDRIRKLVLSLCGFARTDALAMQPTNLHEGIDTTLLILQHRLKPKATSRGIKVVCDYGDLPAVECYGNQINQVFMNLISNAIDALETTDLIQVDFTSVNAIESAHQPQITIRTMQIPDPQGGNPRIVVCIADNGPGISLADQEKLFAPFFTTKPIGKGTGLGLAISRGIIVDNHGGELQCYSQLGEGTEFWIELPVQAVDAKAPAQLDSIGDDLKHEFCYSLSETLINPLA